MTASVSVLMGGYALAAVMWVAYISNPSRPLKNWQWFLSWTVFLPAVLACMLFAAISEIAAWLSKEM